jgi:hypothetical protein
MKRFSGFNLIGEAFRSHQGWPEHWPDKAPKASYDAIIVGAGEVLGQHDPDLLDRGDQPVGHPPSLDLDQHGGKSLAIPGIASLATIVAAVLLVPTAAPEGAAKATTAAASELNAVKYTPAALAELRAQNKPVFLYMTADWCLTCKVNEKGAMADAAVAESFKAKGITVMEGDWTRNDAAISTWLAEHKRAGVPVYVYYDPTGGETELPQILTVDALTTLKV